VEGSPDGVAAASGVGAPGGAVVTKIRQTKRLTKHEVDFLKRHAPGDVKMTLPTANQFPAIAYKKGISERAYPTYSEFLWDIVPIMKAEIAALVSEGVKYIQIDAPRYSYYIDPKWRRHIQEEMGVDPDVALDEAIRVDNACLEGSSARVSPWRCTCAAATTAASGTPRRLRPDRRAPFQPAECRPVPARVRVRARGHVRRAAVRAALEIGRPRSGQQQAPALEPQEHLLRRIEEASRFVPLENLALSPQCGFASTMEGNLLSEQDQWRKLQLVVDTARKVWKDA
jgi:5-methyltetrahydropteroyltriglutamate--homocysteine methyltransferase